MCALARQFGLIVLVLVPALALPEDASTKNYVVASYPLTFLVDRQGKIVDYHLGFDAGDEELLAAAIDKLLAEGEAIGERK